MNWRRFSMVSVPLRLWQQSLLTRSVVTMGALTAVTVLVASFIMVGLTSSSLFNSRLDHVLESSNRAANQAQSMFSSSSANSQAAVQSLLYSVLSTTESITASQDVALFSTPSSSTSAFGLDVTSSGVERQDVPQSLRAKVQSDAGRLWWQSIALDNSGRPGIVTGISLSVPLSGRHELYVVYDLGNDQATLQHLQWMLVGGGASVVLLVALITWLVVGAVLRPVRVAAETSENIAAGALSERLPVRGRDEVTVLASSFNSMADALQLKITELAALTQMQQRFVSDVSHELRTPLTTIRLATDTLYSHRDAFDPVSLRSAELLFEQTDRFETLLADLLEMSRFDAKVAAIDASTVDLGHIAERIVQELADVADRQSVKLVCRCRKGDLTVDGDASRLDRIVRNLVANALEYGSGHPVTVEVAGGPASVAVSVRDHGEGLTPDDIHRVFDRFWRKDAARERTLGGTGLGLSIAAEDTALHHGRLDVWSAVGDGSCFRLTIPRSQDASSPDPPASALASATSPLPLPPKDAQQKGMIAQGVGA